MSHVGALIFGAIRRTEEQLTLALNALDNGQTEDVRAQLRGALLTVRDLADTLGRTRER